MDEATARGTRPAFAKVPVEINADSVLLDTMNFPCRGETYEQPIEYAWKPKPCNHCKVFNHAAKHCPVKLQEPAKEEKAITVWAGNQDAEDETSKDGYQMETDLKRKGKQAELETENDGWKSSRARNHRAVRPTKCNPASSSNPFKALSNLDGDSNINEEDLEAVNDHILQELQYVSNSELSEGENDPIESDLPHVDPLLHGDCAYDQDNPLPLGMDTGHRIHQGAATHSLISS